VKGENTGPPFDGLRPNGGSAHAATGATGRAGGKTDLAGGAPGEAKKKRAEGTSPYRPSAGLTPRVCTVITNECHMQWR